MATTCYPTIEPPILAEFIWLQYNLVFSVGTLKKNSSDIFVLVSTFLITYLSVHYLANPGCLTYVTFVWQEQCFFSRPQLLVYISLMDSVVRASYTKVKHVWWSFIVKSFILYICILIQSFWPRGHTYTRVLSSGPFRSREYCKMFDMA